MLKKMLFKNAKVEWCLLILKLAMITLYFGRGAVPNLGHFFGIPTQRPQSDFQLFSYSI